MLKILFAHLQDLFIGLGNCTRKEDIDFFHKLIDDTFEAIDDELLRKRSEFGKD